MTTSDDWHLDKRVNLSIIVGLVMQAGLFGVGWGVINEKVGQIERRLDGFAERAAIDRREISQQSEEIAVLSQQVTNTNRAVDRLRAEVSLTNELLRESLRSNRLGVAP